MKLQNTIKLMQDKLKAEDLDAYSIVVGLNGQKGFISSSNVDEDTYFDIASIGKVVVTSTLVLKAVGEGKLSLSDTLEQFFDDVPSEKKNISIHKLLTHTSGIIRIPIPKKITEQGNDVIAKHILSEPLAYTPGEGYRYSCNGYILLGFILEKVYSAPLDQIFYERLKTPLGLVRSRFNIAVDEENAAVCHYSRDDVG